MKRRKAAFQLGERKKEQEKERERMRKREEEKRKKFTHEISFT